MFRVNPTYQLSTIVVVVFISFTLQVKYRPFMSEGEFVNVRKSLREKAELALDDEDLLPYRELHNRVGEIYNINLELLKREEGMGRKAAGGKFWDQALFNKREHDRRTRLEKYFFDVNSVEAILLGAIIVIALSGIMFESNQFTRRGFYWQGQLTLIMAFIVVFGSLGYYIMVLFHEFSPWKVDLGRFNRFFMRFDTESGGRAAGKQGANSLPPGKSLRALAVSHTAARDENGDDAEFDDVKLSSNALYASKQAEAHANAVILSRELEELKKQVAVAKKQNEELKRLKTDLEDD